MRINRFFDTVLHASVRNQRWSWGGINEKNHQVFLRVWDDNASYDKGRNRILVLSKKGNKTSAARNERQRHLQLINEGYQLYGVLCTRSESDEPNDAKIQSFDASRLLKFGSLHSEPDGKVYAEIERHVSIHEIEEKPQFVTDIQELSSFDNIDVTTRAALIDARLGQGAFRKALMRRYHNSCAVTGCTISEMLRASHIKPWGKSSNSERLNPNNGLLLIANIDALFDSGLISFTDDGKLLLSDRLNGEKLDVMGNMGPLLIRPSLPQQRFLEYHRKNVFKEPKVNLP
jgi:putative restriction endonuclease